MRAHTPHEKRFAARLHRVREIREISQQQLSDATGIGRSAISEIEHFHRSVTLGEAIGICATIGVTLEAMTSDQPLTLTVDVPVD